MKRIIFISIVMAAFFILIWNWYNYEDINQITSLTPKVQKPVQKTQNSESSDAPPKQNSQTAQKEIKSNESDTVLPKNQLFHHDPLVDMVMGINHFSLCIIKADKKASTRLEQLTSIQNQFLQPELDKCENNHAQISNYQSENLMTRMAEATTKYGQDHIYLQMMLKRGNLSQELINQSIAAIKAMNGNEMILAASLFKPFFKQHLIPTIHQQLGGNNQHISELVTEQAMIMIACEMGANCAANSGLMLMRCLDHETACGLNYVGFIESHYMMGFRNELFIAAGILKKELGLKRF